MPDVKTTRSELIGLKKKVKLAESGHKLLKKKRDGLILEFFAVLKDAKDVRKILSENYAHASSLLSQTIALDGSVEIKSLSMALKEKPSVELKIRNIMGVTIPEVRTSRIRKGMAERGYGLIGTSIRMEQTITAYEELLEAILRAAETETKLRKILLEIEKTKRRVNSLEFVLIPRLKEQASFIRFRLEEMERENIFKMKMVKAKIAE
ncbi:MAG: V-type ATP synthase subunit D [Candidatus Aenigmarchaeota archaeon]|nr:V-type ATP synthase subunit D [Candidatus Aenigmarchaeota archaeon]